MQTIYFMRHATPVSSTGWVRDDDNRPLTEEGEVEATKVVLPKVAKVFVSPAKRAQDTATLAGIEEFETLHYLCSMMDAQLLSVMKEMAEEVPGDVLFIGHQGSFGQVLSANPCELMIVKI